MEQKIEILYIDDNPMDRALVRHVIEKEHKEFNLTLAKSKEEFEEILTTKKFDIVLTDFNILGFEGLQVLELVNQKHPEIPVIIVTGTGSEEIAIETMRKGAYDYVIKSPDHIKRLPKTILNVLNKKQIENERLKAEVEIKRLNRVYAVLSSINQMIIREKNKQKVFDEACRISVEIGDFLIAWIGIVDKKADKIISVAYSGKNNEYIKNLSVDIINDSSKICNVLKSIKENKISIINNIEDSNQDFECKKNAKASGYNSIGSFPIFDDEAIMGTFNIYAKEKNFFDEKEIELINELTKDIAHAIKTIDRENERKNTENALIESEEKYRSLFEEGLSGNFISTLDGKILMANKTFARILGYENIDEIKKINSYDLYKNKESRDEFLKNLKENKILDNKELKLLRKDGQEINIIQNVSGKFNKDGELVEIKGYLFDITDKINVEKKLKQSDDNFRLVFENSPIGIYIALPNGQITDLNKALLEILDSPSIEATKQINILNFKNLVDIGYSAFFKQCLIDGKTIYHEFNYTSKWNKNSILSSYLIPMKNDKGEVVKIYTMMSDITEQRQAEQKLRQSESKYRALFDSSQSSISIIDKNGIVMEVNDYYLKMTGYDREEIIGKNINILSCEDDDAKIKSDIFKILSGEKLLQEVVSKKKNGEYLHLLLNETSIQLLDGEEAILSIATDITQLKNTEAELRKLSRAVEQSSVSIIITNYEGNIEYVNKYFCDTTGYSKEEAIGQNPRIIKSGHQKLEFYKELWETIKQGKDWSGEIENKKKNGELFWEAAYISPVTDKDGKITHFAAIKENITEKKKTIEELKIAKEKAEESNRLKSAFLSNMSHEIRTPMNGILGFLDLLKSPNLNEKEQNKYIEIVNKSGQRLLNTINDIIEISKIEAGQLIVNYTEININELVNDLSLFFEKEANKKGLNFYNHIPNEQIVINSDKYKLESVFTNLIKNAIKFTNEGYIEIGFSLENKNTLRFYVEDTGAGIDSLKINTIFDRFVQGDTNITRPYEGSGLGLSISKAYLDVLGAEIYVKSELGKGSLFQIDFKNSELKILNQTILNELENKEEDLEEKDKNAREITILVAEDDLVNYQYIDLLLFDSNYNILHAKNGIEAVEMCRENPNINLVLMDLKMPELDGFEATKQILSFRKDLPIIAQTAYAFSEDLHKTIDIGCVDFISKPFTKKQLYKVLKKYLEQ